MSIKAEVVKYENMYHGFSCGRMDVKILEGPNKDETINISAYKRHKKGDIIELFAEKMDS